MKDVLEQKLETLQEKYETDTKEAQEIYRALERKTLEEKSKTKKETDHMVEKIKQELREEARNGLDADTRKIVTDNKRMGEELQFQLQTTQELQRELKQAEEKKRELIVEMSLQAEKEEQYALKGHRQTREIKQLQTKVKNLEKSLNQVVHEFEREKNMVTLKNQRELKDYALDTDGLKRLVKVRTKELQTVRELAQTVLDQRTDVEQFFLESLDIVKKELVRQRKEAHARQVEQYRAEMKDTAFRRNPRFPAIKRASIAVNSTSKLPKTPSAKVDIRDLSWEDRERVLRLLFAKINSVQGVLGETTTSSNTFITTQMNEINEI